MDIQPSYTRQPTPAHNPWPVRAVLLVLWGALLAVVLMGGLLAYATTHYANRILPNVRIGAVDVGGLTAEAARAAVADHYGAASTTAYTLRAADRTWSYTAADLGLTVHADQAVDEALLAGRGSANPIGSLTSQALTYLNGVSIAPRLTYDQTRALSALESIAAEVNQAGASGGLSINGFEVIATPAQTARTLDVAASLARLDFALTNPQAGTDVPLVIVEQPASIQNLDEAASLARTALSDGVTLIADDGQGGALGPWTLSREQVAAALRLSLESVGEGAYRYAVDVDLSGATAFLETLAPGLLSSPVDGRFHFNETTRQLEPIVPAIGGRQLDIAATVAALEAAALSPDRTARAQFSYVQPRYHNTVDAAALGILERVAESTTTFTGSDANRRINIAVAVSKMDGVIIAPGEEFSFNTFLGDLTYEEGFVDAKVIFGERTQNGIGGGVCQVSTTIFRAAFNGGYIIIERHAHPYRVGYYEQNGFPPGLDAAIFTPERDFRFQNDTPHHLLIEASIYPATDTLQFRFYSTNTGRTVEIEQPRVANITSIGEVKYEANSSVPLGQTLQTEFPVEGADVNVRRVVRAADGSIIREDNIFTHFLPWGAVYEVNPADPRLAQTP
ncbi:MAG: VanW family protein [Anaerolineae bacterium]|jgi:vancomycin resistance protein YoaR|nr:VanW family protein [Anaerolineae bacterium]